MASDQYEMNKGDPLYDHLATYCIGLISLVSLHKKEIRDQIVALPEVQLDATVEKMVRFSLQPFRPVLENLHKASNQKYVVRYTIWLVEKALSSAYEDVIKPQKDNSDIMQFFRHVRNGVSHGNRFPIRTKETDPSKPLATWRSKVVTLALRGTTVIPDFITLGDLFFLILDMNDYLKKTCSAGA